MLSPFQSESHVRFWPMASNSASERLVFVGGCGQASQQLLESAVAALEEGRIVLVDEVGGESEAARTPTRSAISRIEDGFWPALFDKQRLGRIEH